MRLPLDIYMSRYNLTQQALGVMLGKSQQAIGQWLAHGGYAVHFDGRTTKLQRITRRDEKTVWEA